MAKYRVGIIGGGRKGSQHARAYVLNPLTDVVAIADTDPENLELFCGRFNVPGYSDYKEMLEKEQIDIAAPILPVQRRASKQSCARNRLRQRWKMQTAWWKPADHEELSLAPATWTVTCLPTGKPKRLSIRVN